MLHQLLTGFLYQIGFEGCKIKKALLYQGRLFAELSMGLEAEANPSQQPLRHGIVFKK